MILPLQPAPLEVTHVDVTHSDTSGGIAGASMMKSQLSGGSTTSSTKVCTIC